MRKNRLFALLLALLLPLGGCTPGRGGEASPPDDTQAAQSVPEPEPAPEPVLILANWTAWIFRKNGKKVNQLFINLLFI